MKYPTIKVGDLKRDLASIPDDWDICFGGLEFYRLKKRGEQLIAMEFSQGVDLLDNGRVVVQNFGWKKGVRKFPQTSELVRIKKSVGRRSIEKEALQAKQKELKAKESFKVIPPKSPKRR